MTESDILHLNDPLDIIQLYLEIHQLSESEFDSWLKTKIVFGGTYKQPGFWKSPTFDNPSQPVVGISWFEARAYCTWLSAQTNQLFRLPTEAEWEASIYIDLQNRSLPQIYRRDYYQNVKLVFKTLPVGLHESHRPGIFDITGNISDWTSSKYMSYPHTKSPEREDPNILDIFTDRRSIRGGNWSWQNGRTRASNRSWERPSTRSEEIGFRLLCGSSLIQN